MVALSRAAQGTLAALLAMAAYSAHAAPLADEQRAEVLALVQHQEPDMASNALAIWKLAEVGYKEYKSSALLEDRLRKQGLTVTPGVAGIPTAFVASFKTGAGPVIGILAEYDALPGLSQDSVPVRKATPGKDSAHGCGHNLLGAASVAAAIALKNWMLAKGIKGEVRVYGSPAEEGGSGKVYLVRAGLFNGVDIVLHWHPSDSNSLLYMPTQANISGKFRFHGIAAHAAVAPELGRSALDAVQIMDVATEFLREHVPDRTRIHYVITNGGKAPNMVPDFAEVYYYVRHVDPAVVRDVWSRVEKTAKGAAIATDTTTDVEITGGVYPMLINKTLLDVAGRNLRTVPIQPWNAEQTAFATAIAKTLTQPGPMTPIPVAGPQPSGEAGGSSDVADVSWTVPTVGFSTTTWVPGTAPHSWQSAAASGTSLGTKGALVAAEAMTLTAAELLESPDVIAIAKAELQAARGKDFVYSPLLGDRKPALNYRDPSMQ